MLFVWACKAKCSSSARWAAPLSVVAVGALAGDLTALALRSAWPDRLWASSWGSHWGPAAQFAWPLLLLMIFRGSSWVRALAAALLGFTLCAASIARYQQLQWSEASAQRQVLEVRVTQVSLGFELRPEVWVSYGEPERRALLRWHQRAPPTIGQRWQLLVNLQRPYTASNPGGVDGAALALRQGVHAHGQVVISRLNQPIEAEPRWTLNSLRRALAVRIAELVPEREAAALAMALAVGDTSAISSQQWRVFNATGITHLIAISGLHVTLFCVLVAGLARRVWAQVPALAKCVRRDSFAAVLGVGASAAYAALAGFGVPAQRTLIMLASWYLLRAWARPGYVAPVLSVALLGVLAIDPLAPLGAGFWLSFLAVACLMLFAHSGERQGHWRALWRAQWAVGVGLLPVSLAIFGRYSLGGLAINLVAVPLFSCLWVPLILLATALALPAPSAAAAVLGVYQWMHALIWPLLVHAASQPWVSMALSVPLAWTALATLAALLALLRLAPVLRAVALLLILPAALPHAGALTQGEFRLVVLNTARSPALLVQTAERTLVLGLGESWRSQGARSRAVVDPAMRHYHVHAIDELILPRLDADSAAGAVTLLAEWPVHRLRSAGDTRPPEYEPCPPGESWWWDGIEFRWLSAASCLLQVTGPRYSALLAGHAAAAELAVLGALHADVVVVPRGGAATGHSREFVLRQRARLAIVTQTASGAERATVRTSIADWQQSGAAVWVSGVDGAVEVQARRSSLTWRRP